MACDDILLAISCYENRPGHVTYIDYASDSLQGTSSDSPHDLSLHLASLGELVLLHSLVLVVRKASPKLGLLLDKELTT